MAQSRTFDAVVVGAGLAGLTAAAQLARAERSVLVIDKADSVGGRARTKVDAGFHFNLGPHALYRSGAALRCLGDLGIHPSGAKPPASGGYAILAGRKHALPAGPVSLLTTGLLGLGAKLEIARLLRTVPHLATAPHDTRSVREWLEVNIDDPIARGLVQALFRLTSYANAPEEQSAGANLQQLQLALADSVLYLDGGWQRIVDSLRRCAEAAGTQIRTGTRAEKVEHDGTAFRIRFAGGDSVAAANVVLAVEPECVLQLLDSRLRGEAWPGSLKPVHAACLDIGLRTLPRPRATFALGIDRPLYFSVHTAAARLAPEAANGVIHALLYQPDGEAVTADAAERELEGLVDLMQPGWREQVVTRRFLPRMTVTHGAPTAAGGGLGGRPAVAMPGQPGLYLAGDWVGATGMLADASVASARAAAEAILARSGVRQRIAA